MGTKAISASHGVWGEGRLSQAVGRGRVPDGLPGRMKKSLSRIIPPAAYPLRPGASRGRAKKVIPPQTKRILGASNGLAADL